jgi:uncharacterized protein (TIGR02996 family)
VNPGLPTTVPCANLRTQKGRAISDEDAFLRAIVANPADDAPRLVYADWLEERGDPDSEAKAAFLRDTAALTTRSGRSRRATWRRLQRAARDLPGNWVTIVAKMPIEACPAKYRGRCPKAWEKLTATDNVRTRHCQVCQKPVHLCATVGEAYHHRLFSEPVVVNLSVPRKPGDVPVFGRTRAYRPVHEPTLAELLEEFDEGRGGG